MVMLPSPTSSSSHAPLLFFYHSPFQNPLFLSSFYVRFLLLEKERKQRKGFYNGVSTSLFMIFFLFPSCSSSQNPFSFLSNSKFGFVRKIQRKGGRNGFIKLPSSMLAFCVLEWKENEEKWFIMC